MQSDYHCLTRSGLDLNISVFLAEAAEAAYGDLAVINGWAGPGDFGNGNYFDRQNVQGYTCGNRGGGAASVSGRIRFPSPGAARRGLDRVASCGGLHELIGRRNCHESLVQPFRQVS
jgi:hypothetical protein